jgi:hypothetical protein
MASPTPIASTQHRLPQSGRIRTGVKGGRQGRKSINTFRVTSPDPELLEPVAQRYGGEIKPWNDDKSGDHFEVITRSSKMQVILPPDPLTEWYELWKGDRGLLRRCDGESCELATQSPDGPEIQRVDCICARKEVLDCRYKLRLNVLLPEVATLGTWRLDTSSRYAREEIPGVVDLIEMAQGRGLYNAVLRLEQRTLPGKRFNVPVLDPGVSVESLLAGESRLHALPVTPSPVGELAAGDGEAEVSAALASPPDQFKTDTILPVPDDVVDAIVIDEITGPQPVDPTISRAFIDNLSSHARNRALTRAREIAVELGEPIPTNAASISPLVIDHLIQEWDRNGGTF